MADYTMAEIAAVLAEEANRQKVDPRTALAIFTAENTDDGMFKADKRISLGTTSNKGAAGIGQVMPATAKGLKEKGYLAADVDLNTLQGQAMASVAAIRELQDRYGPDPLRIAVGYNASSKANRKFDADGTLPAETSHYRIKVARFLNMDAPEETPGTQQPTATTERTSTTVSQKEYTPEGRAGVLGAMDMVKQMFQQALGLQAETIGNQIVSTEAAKTALDTQTAATTRKSGALAQIENTKEARQRQAASFIGADMERTDSRLSMYNQQIAVADQMLNNLYPEIDKAKQADPTRDILGWIGAQLTLRQLEPQAQDLQARKDKAIQSALQIQAIADNQAKIQPAVLAGQRIQVVQAETDLAASHATLAKTELDDKLASRKLAGIATQLQYGTISLEMAQRQAEMTARTVSESYGTTDRAGKDVETLLLSQVATGAKMVGMTPPASVAALKLMPADVRARLQLLGSQQVPKLGGSLGETIENIKVLGANNHLRTTMPEAAAFLDTAQSEAKKIYQQKAASDPAFMKLKEEEKERQAYDAVQKQWREQYAATSADNLPEGNPYKMNAEMYAKAPSLANNKIAKYVNELRAADPRAVITDKMVIKYASDQIAAGKPTDMVSRDLVDFYRVGHINQSQLMGLAYFGIDVQDPKKPGVVTHRVATSNIRTPGAFGSLSAGTELDMLKPVEVLKYLVSEQINRAGGDSLTPGSMPSFVPGNLPPMR